MQTIVSSSPEVIYQIANLNELMGNPKAALRWYQILLTKLAGNSNLKGPTDPNILARMGAICNRVKDYFGLYSVNVIYRMKMITKHFTITQNLTSITQ